MIVKDGKVWFCLADACKALGINNPRKVKTRLDSGGVISNDVSKSSKNQHGEFTRTTTMTYIDESNVFRCIFQRSLGKKNPIQVKASLDCAGVISMDVRTSISTNQGPVP